MTKAISSKKQLFGKLRIKGRTARMPRRAPRRGGAFPRRCRNRRGGWRCRCAAFGVCRAEVGVSALRLQQILGEIVPMSDSARFAVDGDAERVGDALDLPHTGVVRERRGEDRPIRPLPCRRKEAEDVCGRGVDRFAKVRAALGRGHARRALEHGGLGHGVVSRAGVQLPTPMSTGSTGEVMRVTMDWSATTSSLAI